MSAPLPFDDEPARSGTVTLSEIVKLSQITEAPGFNPHTDYGEDDGSLLALAESIREEGLLTPPIVVQKSESEYLVVDGHRRIAAARMAGLDEADCQVMTWQWSEDREKALAAYTPEKLLTIALTVNLHRKDMNCMEVAEAIVRLEKLGKTQAEIARKIKRSQGRVSNLARLLMLPDGVRTHLRTGTLKQSQGEELLPLLSEPFTTGEIEKIADMAADSGLSANGLRNVVRERIERGKPKQVTLEEVAGEYSAPNSGEFDSELDARIARTLAGTKGLDKEPKPAPKETTGLTRKDASEQFAAAMAPDPDVVPLSERPSPVSEPVEKHPRVILGEWLNEIGLNWIDAAEKLRDITGTGGDVHKPGMWLRLEPETALNLMELCDWHLQEHGDIAGSAAGSKLNSVVEVYHSLMLERRTEAEKAKAALASPFPDFEEIGQ